MKIAVEGCAHGELDKIYEALGELERQNSIKVDLLIICGDFQSVRNPADLQCMAVPPKYRTMNTFYKYYSGEKVAPVLTIFVGGNHEASNYLSELSYGGWVCPNIYYMGYANVVKVGGIRIAGLSGIYKGRDYLKGHFECPPYDESSKKSVYHVRNMDVFRLKQIKGPIDVCISHDWPRGVYNFGNMKALLKKKPFFREEMETNKLGSQPAEEILLKLKPSYWFAAHLHCKFSAIVPHEDEDRPETRFLALDKCLPRRNFLQILDIDSKSDNVQLEYDPEWLCILRSTNHLLSTSKRTTYMPGQGSSERWDFQPTDTELQNIHQIFNEDFRIPDNFSVTAPTYSPSKPSDNKVETYINPQTEKFCKILDVTDPFAALLDNTSGSFSISDFSCTDTDVSYSSTTSNNPEEISFSEEEDLHETADMNSTESNEFVIDKLGDEDSETSGFFIDKIGSKTKSPQAAKTGPQKEDGNDWDVFFIDKVGSQPSSQSSSGSVKINLDDFCIDPTASPPATSKSSNTFLNSSTPIAEKKIPECFPELKEEALIAQKEEKSEEVQPTVKKFKRRNYDLYKSECDVPL